MTESHPTPRPRRHKNALAAVAVALFVAIAMWLVWLFMGDDAVLRMSMARIGLIFVGLVCVFLFGCFIVVMLSFRRKR